VAKAKKAKRSTRKAPIRVLKQPRKPEPKPAERKPPTLQEMQQPVRELLDNPGFRAELEKARKVSEAVDKLTTPEQREAVSRKREEAMSPGTEAARRQIAAKDLPTHVKNEVNRLKREGQPVPSASYFVEHCRNKHGVSVGLRTMQRLLKTLRG
jgi:hypothetical protein